MVTVGLTSVVLAMILPSRLVALSGWFYFSITPYYTIAGAVFGKRERLALENMKAAGAATTRAAG